MQSNFLNLIDMERLEKLLQGFQKTTNYVTAILDLEGKVILKSGGRTLCSDFHRIHPETNQKCLYSVTDLAGKYQADCKYQFYKCLNGLADVVVPIVINSEHVANLFSGQFFLENPDIEFFRKQAKAYGFDEEKYLEAVSQVPVVSREQVEENLGFLHEITQIFIELALQKKDLMQLNQTLGEEKEKYRLLFEGNPQPMWVYDLQNLAFLEVNDAAIRKYGYSREDFSKMTLKDIRPPEDIDRLLENIKQSDKRLSNSGEWRHKNKRGKVFPVEIISHSITYKEHDARLVLANDITERKNAELALRESEEKYKAIITNIPGGLIHILDRDMRYVFNAGDELERIGLSNEFLQGKSIYDVFPTETAIWIEGYYKKVLNGETVHFEGAFGNEYYKVAASPLRNEQNEVVQILVLSVNISQRKSMEVELVESKRRYRALFESMNAAFVLFEVVADKDGVPVDLVIRSANKRFETSTGLKLAEVLGSRLTEALPGIESDAADWIKTYGNVALSGEAISFENFSEHLGLHLSISAYQAAAGQCAVTFVDITERKNTELALQKSKANLEEYFENDISANYVAGVGGEVLSCNRTFIDLFGIENRLENGRLDIIPFYKDPTDRLRLLNLIRKNRKVENFEVDFVCSNGQIINALINAIGIFDEQDHLEKIRGYIVDITELKRAEEKIKLLNRAVEASSAAILITDSNGLIMYANPVFYKMTGYKSIDVVGKTPRFLNSGKHSRQFYDHLWKTILSGKSWEGEMQNKKKNGELYWEWSMISPILNDADEITNFIAIKEDISFKKQAEETSKRLEFAEQTAKFKQGFLAKMSHEIRTPLVGVLGMLDVLEQSPLNELQLSYLKDIKMSGDNLREIINQVLEYSKMEAGKIELKSVSFEFSTLLESARNLYKDSLMAGVELIVDISPQIPRFVTADKFRLSQIINNLVSNAVKFTSSGNITLKADLETAATSDKPLVIRIQVRDTGKGISEKLQKKLFMPFVQTDEEQGLFYESTGLGLSICKELVELMQGEINVESTEEKGTLFWFTFSADTAGMNLVPEKPEGDISTPKHLRILLVEDAIVLQKIMVLLLNSLGYEVQLAMHGKHALELFQPGKFDLILMDVNMPVMDGVTATKTLKEKYLELPPIVGLSANAFEGDIAKYMSLGMDGYLTKPFNKMDFDKVVSGFFKQE